MPFIKETKQMLPKVLSLIKFPASVPFEYYTDAQLKDLISQCTILKFLREFKNDEVLLGLMQNIKAEQTRRHNEAK